MVAASSAFHLTHWRDRGLRVVEAQLEDPFTMFFNQLTRSAMAKTIEVNLRQRLGEANVLAFPKPDARCILR